jgi:TonB family protein
MRDADLMDNPPSAGWIKWPLPAAISFLAHLSLVAAIFLSGRQWMAANEIIKAQAIDIADSNHPPEHREIAQKEQETQEVSNDQMVQRLNLPMGLPENMRCSVAVTVDPQGKVLNATVTQGTGDEKLDLSIVQAVYRSSPFPKPTSDQLQAGVYRFELHIGAQ